jgi:ABC-2 type transport system ATP-binding protein
MINAIEIRGLHWQPENGFSIKGLDLTVPTGSVYGFLGPNGSGKTSTIRLFMGMAKAGAGEMRVLGGRVPADMPRILARTGYVPEKPHIHPGLTVAESIRFHSAFYPTWDSGWAEEMRGVFRLSPDARFTKLSKGEKGKLLILLALAQRPELLVLDEPTDGLDPVVRRDVLTALLEYVSETGATVFISSHLVHELERFCDWVGVLDDGRLLAEMPMEAFRNEIKRIRVVNPPAMAGGELPFQLLGRHPSDGMVSGESWIVRGWESGMASYFTNRGGTVREVAHLDLEDGFVELLRAARPGVWGGRGGGWANSRRGSKPEHPSGQPTQTDKGEG